MISEILQRQLLRCQQTPQAFRYETIAQAYKFALADPNFVATDDCGVVSRYLPNEKIFIVDGEDSNIKVTYPKDLSLLENLISGKGY
jgi:2-C-methyl-D-erythritol 4-phosphate cytidylyltransferase